MYLLWKGDVILFIKLQFKWFIAVIFSSSPNALLLSWVAYQKENTILFSLLNKWEE